jgi:hypothetical protein
MIKVEQAVEVEVVVLERQLYSPAAYGAAELEWEISLIAEVELE